MDRGAPDDNMHIGVFRYRCLHSFHDIADGDVGRVGSLSYQSDHVSR